MTPDFAALQVDVLQEFPKFTLQKKSDSCFMQMVGFLLKVISFGSNAAFMTSYVTTIWNTVYVPDNWDGYDEAEKCSLLRHERVHMRQARKLTFPLFAFLYLFAFLPLGLAYCRARFEMEAYTETLAAFKDYGYDYSSDDRRAWIMKQFTTSAYGWMWPFPQTVSGWFDAAVAQVDQK